ncbi:MAG: Exosortase EpsH-like protein [Puniceicoccaceae bacterium 5H]|nr:MAG: Exosortase EpsH-like protein [Puniceicoccaceae bacterium 5H]
MLAKFLPSLPAPVRYAALILAGLLIVMILDQQVWWDHDEEYLFGYLVPLFVLYVLYERYPRIQWLFSPQRPSQLSRQQKKQHGRFLERLEQRAGDREAWLPLATAIAWAGLAAGAFLFVWGAFYHALEGRNLVTSNFYSLGFASMLLCGAFLLSSRNEAGEPLSGKLRFTFASLFIFPALIWLLSVPMFGSLDHTISTFLMLKVATVVFHVMDGLGYAIEQKHSVLSLPSGDVGVAEACSGIRSLMACLFAGSFISAVFFDQLWKKIALVASAMALAFFNNLLRSLFLTIWAYDHTPDALHDPVRLFGLDLGNVHDLAGNLVLVLTVAGLLILAMIFSIQLEFDEDDGTPPSSEAHPAT